MEQVQVGGERSPLQASLVGLFQTAATELPKRQYDDAVIGIGRMEEHMPCVFRYSREEDVKHLVEFFWVAPGLRKSRKHTTDDRIVREWIRDERIALDESYIPLFSRFITQIMQYSEEDLYKLCPDAFKEIKAFVVGVRTKSQEQCP